MTTKSFSVSYLKFVPSGQLPDVFGIVGEADALLAGDFVQYGGHGRPFGVDRQRGVHIHGFTPPLRLRRKDRAAQQGHE